MKSFEVEIINNSNSAVAMTLTVLANSAQEALKEIEKRFPDAAVLRIEFKMSRGLVADG